MTDMFSKPKAKSFEPSAEQKALERRQLEDQRKQESDVGEAKALRKKRLRGRTSLLTGSEQGVQGGLKSTLG